MQPKRAIGNVYTDASFDHRDGCAGLAAYFKDDPEYSKFETSRNYSSSSVLSEISAIELALGILSDKPDLYDEVNIWVDCSGAISHCERARLGGFTSFAGHSFYKLAQKIDHLINDCGVTVNFLKVRAHSGIAGNEIADTIAILAMHDDLKEWELAGLIERWERIYGVFRLEESCAQSEESCESSEDDLLTGTINDLEGLSLV